MTTTPTIPPTAAQRIRLLELAAVMRHRAAKVGPMHSWWDDIFDMEALATDRPTHPNWSAEMWEDEAERMLRPIFAPEQLDAIVQEWRSGTFDPAKDWHARTVILTLGELPSWVKAGMTMGSIVDRWAAERS